MRRAMVTGASGFVGRALCASLDPPPECLSLGAPDWKARLRAAPLEGATVFHLAARVHDPHDRDELAFQRDNVDKTRRLAEEAAQRGARRLVFASSIKVYGEQSPGRPLTLDDVPAPRDAYARSKFAAEQALAEVSARTGLEVVVVRSPLVLGPGARGNVERLMALVDSAWPLPFAAIDNRRSFIHVADLARLLGACGEVVRAAGTFIAAHPVSVSTPELVRALRRALSRPERLVAVAPALLEAAAAMAGQRERARRLTRSLEADPSAAEGAFGWTARVGLEAAAGEMAQAWRSGWR